MSDGTASGLVGRAATHLALLVRDGAVRPADLVRAHLGQIDSLNGTIGAFRRVRAAEALAEAEALGGRGDLADLPLAGVPVAIKDNVPVAGEAMREGSAAVSDAPQQRDHELVRRLRSAGAVVVGITNVPELCVYGATDNVFGIARNPWDLERTPGGSSGGSAAAVASAMVPVAHGNDGMGSIRIPSACCGLVGLKPGGGVVPADIGPSNWMGLAENGPLATTVADAALLLSVMAGRPDLRDPAAPRRQLRVAVSAREPLAGLRLDASFRAATFETGSLLGSAGHRVTRADPPYSMGLANDLSAWWFAAVAEEAEGLDRSKLEPRTRRHAGAGRLVRRLDLARPARRDAWRRRAEEFFASFDLLVTPGLATIPIRARRWGERGWAANLAANARYAPFMAPWNLASYPAMVVPAGRHPAGLPLSVQLVAPAGGEGLLLSVARQLEELRPWARHAPSAGLG